MYVQSIKLVNYKSIGDYDENEIVLEPRITTIIGKNESGKSNVLEGMSKIKFKFKNNNAFKEELINRNNTLNVENRYIITLCPNKEDSRLGIHEKTVVELTKDKGIFKGGILYFYRNNFYPTLLKLMAFLENVGESTFRFNQNEAKEYKQLIQDLQDTTYFNTYNIFYFLRLLELRSGYFPIDKRPDLNRYINLLKEHLENVFDRLPIFFYRRNEKSLMATYTLSEVESELKKEYNTSLLKDFIKLTEVTEEQFLVAVKAGTNAIAESLRAKIIRNVNKNINVKFREFYATEEVSLTLSFNTNSVSFLVQTGEGESLKLSERSNGLKWYLETFIDAKANDVIDKNVVYLFDEPGISLHINAQKELQKLFKHLAQQGNQVVYTTHLPYMLDLEDEGIHRIRAVVKSNEGFTKIYKTAYDYRIALKYQQDILAPVVSAIGMSLNTTFGPAYGKLNIVTEGMSDYIYLKMMAQKLRVGLDRYVFIPSVGAENCINICNILEGWGCEFKALFDYDNEGVRAGEKMRNKLGCELGVHYCYLQDVSQSDINSRTFMTEKCIIEDLVTAGEINRFCSECNIDKNIGKTLIAKLMSDAVANGSYQLGTECQDKFRELFSRILI